MFPSFDIDSLYAWMMALLRAGGLVSVLPVFSAPSVPMQMRLVLAVFLAYMAGNYVPGHSSMPEQPAALALVAANELLIGLFMGLVVKIIFFAAEMAGQIISNEMGLTTGSTLDPTSGNNFATAAVLFSNLAALLLLTTGAYHSVLFAYLRSYRYAPVGNLGFSPGALDLFVDADEPNLPARGADVGPGDRRQFRRDADLRGVGQGRAEHQRFHGEFTPRASWPGSPCWG